MTTLPPWDGDAYDREVRAFRQRNKPSRTENRQGRKRVSTVQYDGLARGVATVEELQRRAEVERAMRRRAARENKKGGQ